MSASPMSTAPKRILMVAYHFPPLAGSSGIQRTLRFVQQLPAFGWEPIVLTATPMAYERVDPGLSSEVPAHVHVHRALAFDTAKHLSVKGRYLAAMARPDRWVSWKFDAVRSGMRLIQQFRPDVIWSTYPIATAHLIAQALSRRSGLPWVADFRDPMAQEGYPEDPLTWQQFSAIESGAMSHARLSVFTTPGAARVYRERYPQARTRIEVIENGYDEDSFHGLSDFGEPLNPGCLTLLHSGIVYPSERDPRALFAALGQLKREQRIRPGTLKLRFRAAVHEDMLRQLAVTHDVESLIEILPPQPYRMALQEMLRADGLLVMQGSGCNEQIPAKVYEYLRCNRPILGLTDPSGDTAGVLAQAGVRRIAHLSSQDAIAHELLRFVEALAQGSAERPEAAVVRAAARSERAKSLASSLDELLMRGPSASVA